MTNTDSASVMSFGPLRIRFDDRVLRPRPWTTVQSGWARDLLADSPEGPVLELCSGAGQIGLLSILGVDRRLVMVDMNPVACRYASLNAAAAGLADQVTIRQVEIDRALSVEERFALVIADPPWVRAQDVHRFPEDPIRAINGGDDGLSIARSCLMVAERHLAPGGHLLLQVGDQAQVEALTEFAQRTPSLRVAESRIIDGGGALVHLSSRSLRPSPDRPTTSDGRSTPTTQ